MRRAVHSIATAAVWLAAAEAPAQGLQFNLPVDCDMQKTCSIHKYFDHDPGPGRRDYTCGRLSADGDQGTDFRAPDFPAMERGIAVIAAAAGVVKARRDGMADVSVREIGHDAVKGREGGNGVVIAHGNGWETQYSHMKRGSITVNVGDRVAAGDRLGLIGLSGNTEFPHVELIVRYQQRAVDPFVGVVEAYACGGPRQPLWSEAALAHLPYRASGPLISGFATTRPDANAARRGAYAGDRLPASAAALVFWVDIWGSEAGDLQRFVITGPDQQPLHRTETTLKADNISWFAFGGVQRPASGWPSGTYTGHYELSRDGAAVVQITDTIDVGGD